MYIMHVFKTVKGVTKTDILCAIIQHNVATCSLLTEKICKDVWNTTEVKINKIKNYITNLVFTALENEC